MMKLISLIGIIIVLTTISCSKKAECKCSGSIDSESIDYSETFKSSAKAKEACDSKQSEYENKPFVNVKSYSCTVN